MFVNKDHNKLTLLLRYNTTVEHSSGNNIEPSTADNRCTKFDS